MSALAQCDAFAFIYDQAGDPAPDVLVVLKRVLDASGNPILLGPKTTLTDSAGSFHFTLPEFATAFISARASALWNCPDGRAFTVPPGPSGELVPDFSLPPSTLVEPPLVYVGDVLSIPKASATQDGYLSAADFVAFEAGAADMGITQIDTGGGLTGGPITDTGTISLLPVSGVAGTWSNPTSISINAYGQIIAISATADITPPVITAIGATSITGSGATITWTTDDPSDSQVEYGTTTSYGTSTTLDATPVTNHSVTITGLTASTPYHYRVKSRNTATLLTTSGDNTFTTTIVADTTPPVITAVTATAITATGATITWTTNEPADSQVEYGLTTGYGTSTTLDATLVTSHSVPITGTSASTLYHYRVKSKDAAGNPQASPDATFTTLAAPAALLTGLVSYWKHDEITGSSMDSVVANHNDMVASANVASEPGKIGTCRVSGAGGLQGSLTAPDSPTLDFSANKSMTINGWFNIVDFAASQYPCLLGKWDGAGNDDFLLFYNGLAGDWQFSVTADGTAQISATIHATPTFNTWYMLTAIFDFAAGQISLQVDGGTAATIPFAGPVHHCPQVLTSLIFDIITCDARVDEVGLWQRVLTSGEIAALHASGAGLTWPF